MSDIQSIFQRIQQFANDVYGKFVTTQHAKLTPEQARTNELLAHHAESLSTMRTMFQQHGFDITISPYVLPEMQQVVHHRIGPSRTVSGFRQVWSQLVTQYIREDPTPKILDQYQHINAELTQAIQQIQHDCARFAHVFADTYFVASIHALLNPPTTPEMLLWQLMSPQTPQHIPDGTYNIAVPHPALLQWVLQQPQPGAYAHILAWYTQPADYAHDYDDLLKIVFAPTTTRHPHMVPYDQWPTDQWPTQSYNATIWRPIELPSSTLITAKNERQRTRKFGNLSADQYTFAYGFIPNEYSQEQGYESEDALLFEVDSQDFIIIVSDGVSQSAMGRVGARSVTQMLHVIWQELKQSAGVYDEAFLNAIIKRALYVAKIDANAKVSSRLYSDAFKSSVSERVWRVLDSLYQGGGTQSTFSCVFRIGGVMYAISMGNSGILIQGQQSGIVLHPDDNRFKSDSIRFSSGERTGMRGEPFISVYPTFLAENQCWRVVIHSDALAEYKNRTSLYQHPLERPSGRPLNLDDDLLAACISVDDTTIIELFYGA
jgi:hypothetical protein